MRQSKVYIIIAQLKINLRKIHKKKDRLDTAKLQAFHPCNNKAFLSFLGL